MKSYRVFSSPLSEPYQTFKIPLKSNEQSVIEHNLVTIYLNLEWPDNNHDNPNLLLHIFDKSKKTIGKQRKASVCALPSLEMSPKPMKNETSMSYFQQNQSSLFVNSIQQQNFGSTYQQQYYHHSAVINNEPPTTTTTITTGDHNDVSSTTTTVVFSALQPPLAPPSTTTTTTSLSSHMPIQQIKNELKTQLSPLYRRQQPPNSSPPICSSTNQPYLSAQHVIQTPPTSMDTQPNIQMSPHFKTSRYAFSIAQPYPFPLIALIYLKSIPIDFSLDYFIDPSRSRFCFDQDVISLFLINLLLLKSTIYIYTSFFPSSIDLKTRKTLMKKKR